MSSSLNINACAFIYSTMHVDSLVSYMVVLSFYFSASNSLLWVARWIFILFLNSTSIWSLLACKDLFIFYVLRLSASIAAFWKSMVILSFTSLNFVSSSINKNWQCCGYLNNRWGIYPCKSVECRGCLNRVFLKIRSFFPFYYPPYKYFFSGNVGHFHTNPSIREEKFNIEHKWNKQLQSKLIFYPRTFNQYKPTFLWVFFSLVVLFNLNKRLHS